MHPTLPVEGGVDWLSKVEGEDVCSAPAGLHSGKVHELIGRTHSLFTRRCCKTKKIIYIENVHTN